MEYQAVIFCNTKQKAGKRKLSQSHLQASASEDASCEVDWLTQKMRDANFTVSGLQRSVN